MRSLCGFEMKKILRNRFNQIVMIFGLGIAVFLTVIRIYGVHEYSPEKNYYIHGKEAIESMMQHDNSLTDTLTEEYLTQFLKEYQKETAEEDAGLFTDLFMKNISLITLIGTTNSKINGSWTPSSIADIDTTKQFRFYELRKEKVDYYLNEGNHYGKMSVNEKQYWTDRSNQVTTPFAWGGMQVCDLIWDSVSELFFVIFILVICLAPMFSREYVNRTDAVLLTTVYGKSKLVAAKILASFLFGTAYLLVTGGISVGAACLYLGIQGKHLPVQLWSILIPYDWTVWKAIWINAAVILLLGLAMSALTLAISSVSRSALPALAIDVLILIGASCVPFSRTNRFMNKLLFLLPDKCFSLKRVLGEFVGYEVGTKVISYVAMIFIVYCLVLVIGVLVAGRGFRRHQAGNR